MTLMYTYQTRISLILYPRRRIQYLTGPDDTANNYLATGLILQALSLIKGTEIDQH